MICDTLQHLVRYRGLHPNLDTAIDYLLTHDLAALPLGRTEVDGDKVFINLMDATLHPDAGYHPEYRQRGLGLHQSARRGDRGIYRGLRLSGQHQCSDRCTGRGTLCAVLPGGAA